MKLRLIEIPNPLEAVQGHVYDNMLRFTLQIESRIPAPLEDEPECHKFMCIIMCVTHLAKKATFSQRLTHYSITDEWVTRPERPKGVKDDVKRPVGLPARSWGPEGP